MRKEPLELLYNQHKKPMSVYTASTVWSSTGRDRERVKHVQTCSDTVLESHDTQWLHITAHTPYHGNDIEWHPWLGVYWAMWNKATTCHQIACNNINVCIHKHMYKHMHTCHTCIQSTHVHIHVCTYVTHSYIQTHKVTHRERHTSTNKQMYTQQWPQ